ncbi:MAG: hypothetical protein H6705_16805 [Myxococcales bacterium]|nr:hypothetical protein [Myxococcales bacterium]
MDAASRTPARRHRAACEAVGIDPGVVGSLAFDKLEDLAALFWLAAGRSGNARDIHSRLSYLEARDFIRVVWRRRGRERPGVVFISRLMAGVVQETARMSKARVSDPTAVWAALIDALRARSGLPHDLDAPETATEVLGCRRRGGI